MTIDLTGEHEQDWLREEAAPLKRSELSDGDIITGMKQELLPYLASEVTGHMADSSTVDETNLQESDYAQIAAIILGTIPEEKLDEMSDDAKEAADGAEVSPRRFSKMYVNELVKQILNQVDDGVLATLARSVMTIRQELSDSKNC